MAIVFISPREKQKVFIMGIAVFFGVVLILISLGVFLSKPKSVEKDKVVFVAPKININFDVLKSPLLQALEFMPEIEKEFNYRAFTLEGKEQSGKIRAVSQNKAIELLTAMNLTKIELTEVAPGRENPFSPYYKIETSPPKKTGAKTKK